MGAPGIISVRTGTYAELHSQSYCQQKRITGPKLGGPDGHAEPHSAVSITQWTSLQAHQDFTSSSAAQTFFEGMAELTEGPPIVSHYDLGELRSFEHLPFIKVHIYASSEEKAQLVDHLTRGTSDSRAGVCMEDDGKMLMLLFSLTGESTRKPVSGQHGVPGSSFDLHVQSLGVASDTARL